VEEEKMAEKKLSKKDLVRTWFRWLCLAHTSYSYERYQGMGFCQAVAPAMAKLYEEKEELGRTLERHGEFFNTEPYTGGMITGAVLAMEESRANGEPVPEEAISSLKTGFMGPFAGLGDSLVQGIIVPVLLALGISMASNGSIMGPVLYVLLNSALLLSLGYYCFFSGYKIGVSAIHRLVSGGLMDKFMRFAAILGCAVLGALASSYINVSTTLSFNFSSGSYSLQTGLFDAVLPGLLSLATVLILYRLFKKGVSSLKVLLILAAVGCVCGLLGIM